MDHHQGVCLYLAKITEYLKIKKKFFLNNSVIIQRGTDILPEDDLLRSKHVEVPLNIFMYFNEFNILD